MLFELAATSRRGTELFTDGGQLAPGPAGPAGATTVSKPSPLLGIFDRLQVLITGYLRNLNWRYLPYIRPKFQRISPQKMAKHMVLTYLHFRILKFPV